MREPIFIPEEDRPDLMGCVARECWRVGLILEEMAGQAPVDAAPSCPRGAEVADVTVPVRDTARDE